MSESLVSADELAEVRARLLHREPSASTPIRCKQTTGKSEQQPPCITIVVEENGYEGEFSEENFIRILAFSNALAGPRRWDGGNELTTDGAGRRVLRWAGGVLELGKTKACRMPVPPFDLVLDEGVVEVLKAAARERGWL